MSWSIPTITACCDRCRSAEEIELTETAHGWDARYEAMSTMGCESYSRE